MARRPKVDRFEPSPEFRDRLRKACTADDGLVFADIRWSEPHGCLAIFELRQDRQTWIARECLLDEHGSPRQAHAGDIAKAEKAMHQARNCFDQHWYEKEVLEFNREQEESARRSFVDEVGQIGAMASEMARRGHCWHGDDPATCKPCAMGEKMADEERARRRDATRRTVTVTDRRRTVA